MQIVIAGSIVIATSLLILLIFAITQKSKRTKEMRREEQALKGVASGIGARLHAAHPKSKWRWVCRPAGFAVSGGIARIEVVYTSGEQCFMDVCLSDSGYMALHMINVTELAVANDEQLDGGYAAPADGKNLNTASVVMDTTIKPHDRETVGKWYNIVLINNLTTLIDDLNAQGEVFLIINKDGKAFVEDGVSNTTVFDFGELPDELLWDFIIEKLSVEGLFVEVHENSGIFISWA